jgi:hypothetical protein
MGAVAAVTTSIGSWRPGCFAELVIEPREARNDDGKRRAAACRGAALPTKV